MGRIVLDHDNVGSQSGPRIGTLNEIMTEEGIPRKTAGKNARHRVHFVNPFTGECAFAEQILVNVGDGAGIRVKPTLASENGCQSRARRALHTHIDAGLQNAISGHHDITDGVDDRLIQRVRNRSHHAMRRSAR